MQPLPTSAEVDTPASLEIKEILDPEVCPPERVSCRPLTHPAPNPSLYNHQPSTSQDSLGVRSLRKTRFRSAGSPLDRPRICPLFFTQTRPHARQYPE
jgi:hypothetical protein